MVFVLFCDTLGCSVCMCVGGWVETLTPLFTSFSFLRAGISPSMEIDSLDPIPFSSTGAGTFVFALREMVVRLLEQFSSTERTTSLTSCPLCEVAQVSSSVYPILSWLSFSVLCSSLFSFLSSLSFLSVSFVSLVCSSKSLLLLPSNFRVEKSPPSTNSTSCSDSFVVQKMLLLCYFRCSRCLRYLCFLRCPQNYLYSGCPLNRERNRTEIIRVVSRV